MTRRVPEPPVLPAGAELIETPGAEPVIASPTLTGRHLRWLRVAVGGALLLLFGQSLRLQVTAGSLFRREAEANRVQSLVEYAPRGVFLDRFGTPLVQNVPAVQLVADPKLLPDDLEGVYHTLQEALPQRERTAAREQLSAMSRLATSPVVVFEGLTHAEHVAVASRLSRLPGFRLEVTAVRAYTGNGPFAHVLGYTGKLNPEELNRFPDYLLTESLGKAGLERQYESLLRGRHGFRKVEVDAYGGIQQNLGRDPAVPGVNLRLALDAGLHGVLTDTLEQAARAVRSRRAAAVALDPFTGGIRALVSLPTFPHSDLAQGTRPEVVRATLADPASPLLNRVVQGEYVPGSTFKLAVAAAALEEGILTPGFSVSSTGGLQVSRWFFPDWKAGGHGRTGLTKALAESVNTFFYTIGGGHEDIRGLGIARIATWARKLGIGQPTGVDLPEETTGFLPSPEWKERAKGESWYIGDTYHAAIGQGDVLLTPLQLAVLTAAVANGGAVVVPHLAEATVGPDGRERERFPPRTREDRAIKAETAAAIREGMRAAVTAGSARGLSSLLVPVAAKTGTAEVTDEKTHAWVTVIAPAERPELVLVVLIEEGGGGDRVAVPVAHDVLAWYFAREQVAQRATLGGP